MQERFDRFADKVENAVSNAAFFAFCVLTVIIWAPSFFVIPKVDTWQLIINTFTTIVTFLLVALLQNTQARFERAVNARLCAILAALDLSDPVDDEGQKEEEAA